MDKIKQLIGTYKVIITGVSVILLALLAYSIYTAGEPQEDNASLIRNTNQSVVNSEIGREIVSTLNRLKGINIDPEFFEEPHFTRLVDFSVEIEQQPIGKTNPFKNEVDTSLDTEVEGSEVFDEFLEENQEVDTQVLGPIEDVQ